jgi:hypothetical protein
MIFGRYLDPSQVAPAGVHGEERPRSRSHVSPGSGVTPPVAAPAASVATPASSPAVVPVADPAARAATPAAGK